MTNSARPIAIIPARGGSKRIPRKNIKPFHGKPIIHYPIRAALDSGIFSEVMVSTDDEEIAAIARQAGASVPFLRSLENSNDFATMGDALREVLETYAKSGRTFDSFACLFSTAPFITTSRLLEAERIMREKRADSVVAVTRFGFPIQRALKVENGKLVMISPEFLLTRSQDLPPSFHDNGQFFFCRTDTFLNQKKVMTDNSYPLEIPEPQTQDIDSEEDWLMAELKFELMQRAGNQR